MKPLQTILKALLALLASLSAYQVQAQPSSCSAPGKDGIAYSAPSYYPGNATAAAGATNIALGAIRAAGGTNLPAGSGTPGTTAIGPGDLVMIIQMQDASYNNSDGAAYGGLGGGRGWTNINSAGRYEFRRAVSFTGGNLVVDQPLSFTYTRANPSAGNGANENGNRRFQVVRVPQFSNVQLPGGTIAPPAWNGETGGVFVIDVADTLTMNNTTIDATALGFRGGGAWPTYPLIGGSTTTGVISYVNTRTFNVTTNAYCSTNYDALSAGFTLSTYPNVGGAKGEGIAGTPRLVRRQATTNSGTYETPFAYQDLTTVGYANGGFMARGAPGNAGGGGTQHNAGGGGGSNVGQGGVGGNSFAFYRNPATGVCVNFGGTFNACDGDFARAMGGIGGGTLAASIDRVIMGGGGGAGDANNNCDNPALPQSAGGNGGGIVFLRAGAIAGSGTLLANGQNGLPGGRDSAGGGGAGGSVVVLTATNNPALTIQANGGQGGNTGYSGTGGVPGVVLRSGETQGPAGGGGGGAVVRSSNIPAAGGFTSVVFAGGAAGANFPVNGNTAISNAYGAGSGGGAAATVPFVPTSQAFAANCLPQLAVSKSTTTPTVTIPAGNTAQYVISLTNRGTGTAVGVTLQDTLQSPFRYTPTLAPINQIGVATAGNSVGPASPVIGSGTQTFVVGTPGSSALTNSWLLPPASTVTYTVTVRIDGGGTPTAGTAYQNSVTLNYLDPFRATATAQVTPGATYNNGTAVGGSNYASGSSTQEDVRVVGSVDLRVTKTNNVGTLTAGSTTSYTITVANFGPLQTPNAILTDPITPGLSCTSVTCTAFGTAQCPAAASTTVANLQGAGITIPLLTATTAGPPPPNRVEFRVQCNVTATGQ
jgi:uncharacterized repeat protein (TIGR01451 family)